MRFRVLAVLVIVAAALLVGPTVAVAQDTTPSVQSLLDVSSLGASLLTILGGVMAAVAGVILSIAIGKAVIRWFTRAARA